MNTYRVFLRSESEPVRVFADRYFEDESVGQESHFYFYVGTEIVFEVQESDVIGVVVEN